jgi:hypothetical protein
MWESKTLGLETPGLSTTISLMDDFGKMNKLSGLHCPHGVNGINNCLGDFMERIYKDWE